MTILPGPIARVKAVKRLARPFFSDRLSTTSVSRQSRMYGWPTVVRGPRDMARFVIDNEDLELRARVCRVREAGTEGGAQLGGSSRLARAREAGDGDESHPSMLRRGCRAVIVK